MTTDLDSITTEVQTALADTGTVFTDGAVKQAILLALRELNTVDHYDRIGTITLAAASREISLSSLVQPSRVDRVWLPYTVGNPEDPPEWRAFEQWSDTLLYVTDDSEPDAADVARIFYHTPHLLDDLDSASETTLNTTQIGALINGAAAYALDVRIRTISESISANKFAVKNLESLRNRFRNIFDAYLRRQSRASAGGFTSW